MIFSALVIMTGILGILLPYLPGVPLIFTGLLIYALGTGLEKINLVTIIIMAILAGVSLLNDYLLTFFGAKKMGITRFGIGGGVIGLLIGLIFSPLGLVSLIVCPILGIIIGELIAGRQVAKAAKVGLGALIGFTFGVMINLAIAGIMIYIFLFTIM